MTVSFSRSAESFTWECIRYDYPSFEYAVARKMCKRFHADSPECFFQELWNDLFRAEKRLNSGHSTGLYSMLRNFSKWEVSQFKDPQVYQAIKEDFRVIFFIPWELRHQWYYANRAVKANSEAFFGLPYTMQDLLFKIFHEKGPASTSNTQIARIQSMKINYTIAPYLNYLFPKFNLRDTINSGKIELIYQDDHVQSKRAKRG